MGRQMASLLTKTTKANKPTYHEDTITWLREFPAAGFEQLIRVTGVAPDYIPTSVASEAMGTKGDANPV